MKNIILFIFFSNLIYCQTSKIKGIVKDSLGIPISLANIQLIKHNSKEIIEFKSTNNHGAFEFNVDDDFTNLDVVVSHISFFSKTLSIEKNKILEIILKYKENQLQEIKIKADFKSVEDKNDTIKYNLKKLTNGSEEKLKDVINKLPGLKIDENGKIKFNGKIIDDFLIEGDELYNSQHQLATENIKSEMIDKIEVLKNYKKFSSIDDNDGAKKTALNVYIKNEFKNSINGVIDIEGGHKKRYKIHDYFFNFNNKLKASLISDINNVNSNVLNVNDYFDLKKISSKEIDSEDNNNITNIDDNVPEFLFANDDVKSKNIKNLTFNFNKVLSKSSKIQGYSTTNVLSQEQFLDSKQLFFSNYQSEIERSSSIYGNSMFNSNYLKFEKKKNENTYSSYTISTNYNKDSQKSIFTRSLDNIRDNFVEEKDNESFIFGQNFLFKNKISSKSKIDFILYNEITNIKDNINLESNSPFLNLQFRDLYSTYQNTVQSRFRFGGKLKYSFKKNKNNFNFQLGSSLLNESYDNYVNQINPTYNFNLRSNKYNNYIGINYSTAFNKKIKFSLGADLNYTASDIINYSRNKNISLFPFSSLSFVFNKKSSINFSYKRNLTSFTLNQFIKGNVIDDYTTVLKSNELMDNSFFISNQYAMSYIYTNFDKNINGFFNIIFDNKVKNITSNSFNENNIFYNENKFNNLDNATYILFNFEKKIKTLPFGLSFQSMFSLFDKQSYINHISNELMISQSKYDLSFMSYFKNNDFNFNCGISYGNSYSKNLDNGSRNSLKKITPFVNFNGLIFNDKLNWEVKNSYFIFTSSSFEIKNIFDIRPKLSLKRNSWNYFISGNNILNIKDNNIKVKSNNNATNFEQSRYNSLSGYINLGVSFSF